MWKYGNNLKLEIMDHIFRKTVKVSHVNTEKPWRILKKNKSRKVANDGDVID